MGGQLARGGQGTDDEAQSTQPQQTQPERHRVREDDPRELLGRDTPSRIEAIPHGGAGQHGEADVVGNRVRQERRQRDARARKGLADVGERQQVVAGERRVVEGREHQGEPKLRRRRADHISREFMPTDGAQLDAKHLEGDEEQHETDDDRDRLTQPFRHGEPQRAAF